MKFHLPSAIPRSVPLGVVVLFLAVAPDAPASPLAEGGAYALSRQVIATGGGHSSGGVFDLHGTVGQSLTGASGNGPAAVLSGFWQPIDQIPATENLFMDGFESANPKRLQADSLSANPTLAKSSQGDRP